jgi:hypothetical protein
MEPSPPPVAEPLPRVFRERAATRQKVREAAAVGVIWAGLGAGFVLVLAALALLRQDIARVWPRTAGVYAAVGLPVNLVGLVIENQRAQPQLKDGHAALAVSGALRNIRDRPVVAPPLRISLLNAAGRVLAVRISDPGGARIPPGEARRFVIDMLDPPASVTDVEITCMLDRPPSTARAAAPAGAPPSARLSLRGAPTPSAPIPSAPVLFAPGSPIQEAKPLPGTSPYALPNSNGPAAGPRG